MMDTRTKESLDRHITGNYGEDQSAGYVECATCEGILFQEEATASLVHDHKRKFFCSFKCANTYLNKHNEVKE